MQEQSNNNIVSKMGNDQKEMLLKSLLQDPHVLGHLTHNVFPSSSDRDIMKRLYHSMELDLVLYAVDRGN